MAQFTDSFSGSGALGNTESGGGSWQVVSGSWSRSGGYAYSSTLPSSNPIAVIDTGSRDTDLSLSVSSGGGDSVYFRVIDTNNWFRVRVRRYQQTVTNYYTEYEWADVQTSYTTNYEWQQNYYCPSWTSTQGDTVRTGWGSFSSAPSFPSSFSTSHYGYTGYPGYPSAPPGESSYTYGDQFSHSHYRSGSPFKTGATSTSSSSYVAGYYWGGSTSSDPNDYRTGNTRQASYNSTNTYYQIVVEKNVSGSITQLAAYSVTPSSLRVLAQGSAINVYVNGTPQAGLTDSSHLTATRHGIGLAASELTGSAIDNFSLTTLNTAPDTPILVSPVGGQGIDRMSVQRFEWQFVDPNLGDGQTAFELRYRQAGSVTWVSVNQSTTNQYWDAPAATFLNDTDYEWQVRTYDSAAAVSSWSTLGQFSVPPQLGSVIVGGVKKPVVQMSVIVGGVKKPAEEVSVVVGGAKRPLGP